MVLIGGKKRATNWMNLSQPRRAVWLRRLSDASQSRFILLKNHHRLGWLYGLTPPDLSFRLEISIASFFGYHLSSVRTAEDKSPKSNGVNKSAKVVLVKPLDVGSEFSPRNRKDFEVWAYTSLSSTSPNAYLSLFPKDASV